MQSRQPSTVRNPEENQRRSFASIVPPLGGSTRPLRRQRARDTNAALARGSRRSCPLWAASGDPTSSDPDHPANGYGLVRRRARRLLLMLCAAGVLEAGRWLKALVAWGSCVHLQEPDVSNSGHWLDAARVLEGDMAGGAGLC